MFHAAGYALNDGQLEIYDSSSVWRTILQLSGQVQTDCIIQNFTCSAAFPDRSDPNLIPKLNIDSGAHLFAILGMVNFHNVRFHQDVLLV
jgi:hypothetical protein